MLDNVSLGTQLCELSVWSFVCYNLSLGTGWWIVSVQTPVTEHQRNTCPLLWGVQGGRGHDMTNHENRFMVFSQRGEPDLLAALYLTEKYCSEPKLWLVESQRILYVFLLYTRFSNAIWCQTLFIRLQIYHLNFLSHHPQTFMILLKAWKSRK